MPLLTLYVKLALLTGGVGNNRGAVLGAFVHRVPAGIDPVRHPAGAGLSPVQGAALRETADPRFMIVMLRFRSQGILPEAPSHPVVPVVEAEAERVRVSIGAQVGDEEYSYFRRYRESYGDRCS